MPLPPRRTRIPGTIDPLIIRPKLSSTIAPLKGSAGMTEIVSTSADDANIVWPDIRFNFKFYNTTYRSNIYTGSNSYVTFGYGSNIFNSLSYTNPGRGLFIGAADHSYIKVYAKADNPGSDYRVRFEGHINRNSANPLIWEVTLFASGEIQLATGTVPSTGATYITDGGGTNFTNYTLVNNTSFVFYKALETDANYVVQTGSVVS